MQRLLRTLKEPAPGRTRATVVLSLIALVSAILLTSGRSSAQAPSRQSSIHLNPVVAKLAEGKPFFGLSTSDLSLANARVMARAPVDFVYVDMEHTPLNFESLHNFLVGMTDKAMVLRKGNLQPDVALFARFPQEADESTWVVKQALDLGLMGVIFNGVDTREQALTAVRSMRYPQMKGTAHMEPRGIRGSAPALAAWMWGLNAEEYERHADVWPLNPEGDLMAILMIESVEGIQNLDQILSVPGIGAIFLGAGSDLSHSLGVRPNNPELEAAFQTILKACKAHNVPCGISPSTGPDIAKRVGEGWKMIRTTTTAMAEWRASNPGR
jgi:4-hydroxy-2-oxoheptanedioate aldolase